MTVDIYIREKDGNREIRIPLLPEKFSFPKGDAMFISCDIVGRGEVVIPSGTELGTYSWESEFPGSLRKNDPMMRGTWQDPKNYQSIIEDWKHNGTKLNLMITGYPVNVDVYCEEFSTEGAGPFGDIVYEISFIEARDLTITNNNSSTTTTTKRGFTLPNCYMIKSGDSLWSIAQMLLGAGSKWQSIYSANKDILEKTAKKYGKSSSLNGHWIYPGVILSIPNVKK